eukprot:6051320-Lingulodinium_polyedra.AAC.1
MALASSPARRSRKIGLAQRSGRPALPGAGGPHALPADPPIRLNGRAINAEAPARPQPPGSLPGARPKKRRRVAAVCLAGPGPPALPN